jgi:pyruvate,water dikinase
MAESAPRVRPFQAIGLGDTPSVGGKGANLGELMRAGIRVPPGFVVTTACFDEFLSALDPGRALRARIEALDASDTAAITAASREVRAQLEGAALPASAEDEIAANYAQLCAEEADLPVAVRSSATSEDSEDASFAGLQYTYLWLRGAERVIHHVRACWASLYSPESISYRRRLNFPEDGLAMGVVVQQMVDSRCSGVMFTRSPLTGDRSVVVIEGSYGLGSAIVSGEVTPDKFVVDKVSGDITDRAVMQKTRMHVPDLETGGIADLAVEEPKQTLACLTDAELVALAELGKRVERHYGKPQDIEWAIAHGRAGDIFLLQSRPETVWSRKDAKPVVQPKANALEHVFAVFGGNR